MIPAFDIKSIKRKYALRNKLLMIRTRALASSLEGRGVSSIDQAPLKEFIFWYPWREHPLVKAVYFPLYEAIFEKARSGSEMPKDSVSDLLILGGWVKKIDSGALGIRQETILKLNRLDRALTGGYLNTHISSNRRKQSALTKLFNKIQKKNPELIDQYRQVLKESNRGRIDL